MAGFYPLTIDQGATLDRLITWTNAAGTPYDLSGWTARMQIRDKPGGSSLYQTLTTDDSTIVLGGAAGTIRLVLAAATTSAWTWQTGHYDLELTNPDGAVTRLLQGKATLSPQVTL